MTTLPIRARRLATAELVAQETARRILAAAGRAIRSRGMFRLVLAGGRTPLAAYTLLVDERADWERWHIFLGDERCLPVEDPDRNSRAIADAFLDRVGIPNQNLHPMAAELGAESAALAYESVIAAAVPFDLVLLGMGDDGHTASLFPGHPTMQGPLVVPVHGAPKPPSDRVSLSPRALADSREMLILVTGSGKADALLAWRRGADLPVVRVATLGRATVLLDESAAGPLGGGDAEELSLPGLA